MRMLARAPGATSFLEIGCGGGAFASLIAPRFAYVGYEPDPRSCAAARRRLRPPATVICGYLPEQPERHFDLVGAFEVLEHIADDSAAIDAWQQWVRPGGHLLLSVPAHPERFAAADEKVGHYRRYRRDDLLRRLEARGFEDVLIWAYGFPLGYLLEAARNQLAGRGTYGDKHAQTGASGRWLQPPASIAWLTRAGTWPFRVAQRSVLLSDLGTGYVAMARRAR